MNLTFRGWALGFRLVQGLSGFPILIGPFLFSPPEARGQRSPEAPKLLQPEGSESSGSMGLESSLPEMWRLPGRLSKIEVMQGFGADGLEGKASRSRV